MKIIFIFACSGMFQDVPGCSGMFHVPDFIDGLFFSLVQLNALTSTNDLLANHKSIIGLFYSVV